MKLEDQVCSLELAKKLRELGVKQESYFHWFAHREMGTSELIEWKILTHRGGSDESCSAFTVAELGEMLPGLYYSERWAGSGDWVCNLDIGARTEKRDYPNQRAATEADARAKMLVYLLENWRVSL